MTSFCKWTLLTEKTYNRMYYVAFCRLVRSHLKPCGYSNHIFANIQNFHFRQVSHKNHITNCNFGSKKQKAGSLLFPSNMRLLLRVIYFCCKAIYVISYPYNNPINLYFLP